jgi:hypothetical protein
MAATATADTPTHRFALVGLLATVAVMIGVATAITVESSASSAPPTHEDPADVVITDTTPVGEPARPLRVVVVGDSLIASTTPDQHAELTRRGYEANVHGNPGKPLTDPWIQARLHEANVADIVVLATASNDNVHLANRAGQIGTEQASSEYADTLRRTLDRAAVPCTVVVDVRDRSAGIYRPELAPVTNATLVAVAGSAPRPTVVVPWSQVSVHHDQTDWFVADELHFVDEHQHRMAGVQAYAHAIADGVDRCRALLDERGATDTKKGEQT